MFLTRWRRNVGTARDDIGRRYLAALRLQLLAMPPPHLMMEWSPDDHARLRDVWLGRRRCDGALTMLGGLRLIQVENAIRDVIRRGVRGDLLEAGAWRGGCCLYMRAVLDVLGIRNRIVWTCDAFDGGFPAPDGRFPIDNDCTLHERSYFKTSAEQVGGFFKEYGYFDPQLRIVVGEFKEVLPQISVTRLALLRVDGDMYQSTWDTLTALYDKVSPGGYVICDDYQALRMTTEAVDDFRAERHITAPLRFDEWNAAYWIKEAA